MKSDDAATAAVEAAGGVYIVVSDTEEAAKIGMSITK